MGGPSTLSARLRRILGLRAPGNWFCRYTGELLFVRGDEGLMIQSHKLRIPESKRRTSRKKKKKKKKYEGDPCEAILKYAMESVCTFYDHQLSDGYVDWTTCKVHRHAFKSMKRVHKWWRTDRGVLEASCSKYPFDGPIFVPVPGKKGFSTINFSKRDRRSLARIEKIKARIDRTDREMLLLIVEILPYLWD